MAWEVRLLFTGVMDSSPLKTLLFTDNIIVKHKKPRVLCIFEVVIMVMKAKFFTSL